MCFLQIFASFLKNFGHLPMANIVRGIVAEGVSKEEIQARLGMEDEEVDRLVDRAGMPTQAGRKKEDFGASWKPKAKDVE